MSSVFLIQGLVLKKALPQKKHHKVDRAQVKTSFILCYYVLQGVLGLASLSQHVVGGRLVATRLAEFFLCKSFGDSQDCLLELPGGTEGLVAAALVTLTLLPVVALIFSFDVRALRKLVHA